MCQVKFNENIFTLNCFLELYTIFFSLPVACWTYNQNIVEYCTCDIITHYRAATAGKAPKVWALHCVGQVTERGHHKF